ncbi:type II toxin-antitoxin system Phd/YefM family antitoxin [Chloroflexi bacterium TSY]|nr:type II toxin-antitoxin system Phd/YefM family antitoxin [Chloroflexi bacterium TSY]
MSIHVGTREVRNKLSDLIGQVHYGGETVIVERSGKPMVAMIPIAMFEQLIAEREERFRILDQIRRRLPDVPEDEVLQDVATALEAVRHRVVEEG